VDDAAGVRVVEGGEHLQQGFHGLRRLQAAGDRQEVPEVRTVHVLHDHERRAAGLAPVVDLDDVWMRQVRGGAGLPAEPVDERVVTGQRGMQDLDGDLAGEDGVASPQDLAHAACGDTGHDLVAAVDRG
jgi:hypothetical protein